MAPTAPNFFFNVFLLINVLFKKYRALVVEYEPSTIYNFITELYYTSDDTKIYFCSPTTFNHI